MRITVTGPSTPVEREVAFLVSEILHESPQRGLAATRLLTTRYVPWLMRRHVRRLRAGGSSWTGIGRILGVSRQAVQKRFDDSPTMDAMLPPTLPTSTSGPDREYRDLVAKLRHLRAMEDADSTGEAVPW